MSENQPIREFRPVVVPAQYLVWGPLIAGFLSIFPGMFVFVISNIIRNIIVAHSFSPVFMYGVAAYIISFSIIMYLIYLKMYKEPERTMYTLYEDRLEYYEGFLNRQQRTVVFDQVIDIYLSEGLLQQTKGVGSVVLVTQQLVSSGEAKLSNRRVTLHNVPEPQQVYDLLRTVAIDKKEAGEPIK
ncbi:MAG: PH domain-containing protein [Planctomycetota bacterium]